MQLQAGPVPETMAKCLVHCRAACTSGHAVFSPVLQHNYDYLVHDPLQSCKLTKHTLRLVDKSQNSIDRSVQLSAAGSRQRAIHVYDSTLTLLNSRAATQQYTTAGAHLPIAVANIDLSLGTRPKFQNRWSSERKHQQQREGVRAMASNGRDYPAQKQGPQPGREHEMHPTPIHTRPNYVPAGKLQGKVAVITGGDSGIGRAVASLYTLEGASVAITYLPEFEEKDADDTLDIIKKNKTADAKDPIKIGIDLGFDENCKMVIDEVIKHFGRLDILVNNAAEQHVVPNFDDIDPKQVERTFRTNIFSQFFLSKYALKHMKEGSSIINTTSINAYRGNASLIDYASTKGAIVSFTRALALHLAPRQIRVNGVAPGPIWTPLIPATFPASKTENYGSGAPLGRAGEPHEVATSFVFLASEDGSYFSGQVLHPNGGVPVNT